MKSSLISLLLLVLFITSCKSEYQERLDEAKDLKEKMSLVKASNELLPREKLIHQIRSIKEEINFLAKLSGNEELFMKEVYEE